MNALKALWSAKTELLANTAPLGSKPIKIILNVKSVLLLHTHQQSTQTVCFVLMGLTLLQIGASVSSTMRLSVKIFFTIPTCLVTNRYVQILKTKNSVSIIMLDLSTP